MEDEAYLHGYSDLEQNRLIDQNKILSKFIYEKIDLSNVQDLVEIGSGVGAQMMKVLNTYPNLNATGFEISKKQVFKARENLSISQIPNHRFDFKVLDARSTGLPDKSNFDGALLVWVLEHTPKPEEILTELNRILLPESPVFITEVFNNSLNFFPPCPAAQHFWSKVNEFQASIGGDGNIGLRLGNLLEDTGFKQIKVESYPIHFDKRQPEKRQMILEYWLGLMHSSVPNLIEANYITEAEWMATKKEIETVMKNENGLFYYSFIQAFAVSSS